jgi:hypothetical protein
MTSFMTSYCLATLEKTLPTSISFSCSGTVLKPKCVVSGDRDGSGWVSSVIGEVFEFVLSGLSGILPSTVSLRHKDKDLHGPDRRTDNGRIIKGGQKIIYFSFFSSLTAAGGSLEK